jgi:hypothetical protein
MERIRPLNESNIEILNNSLNAGEIKRVSLSSRLITVRFHNCEPAYFSKNKTAWSFMKTWDRLGVDVEYGGIVWSQYLFIGGPLDGKWIRSHGGPKEVYHKTIGQDVPSVYHKETVSYMDKTFSFYAMEGYERKGD